jgi:hypothetical protein
VYQAEESQSSKTLHSKKKNKSKSKSSSQPLKDITVNSNMAPKKKKTAAQIARENEKAAIAKADQLAAELAKMRAKLAEKSGRKPEGRTKKHKKSSKSSSDSHRASRKSNERTPSNKRKVAPTSDSVATKKHRGSEKKQGHSDGKKPSSALELQINGLLAAKRRYGGRRSSAKNNVQDEMLTRISTAIKNHSFDKLKFVLGEKGKKKLTNGILDHLKMEGYYGEGKHIEANRANFLELYGDDCVQALNAVRSSTSTEIKKAARAWYDSHGGTLPTDEALDRLIKRDLDFNNADDVEMFGWYQMNLIPKAVGSATNWNKAKREYHCLSSGAPSKSKKPYISPETEAYALMQLKGNTGRWLKQFQVADHETYKGKIQRILGRKKPGEKDPPMTDRWIMEEYDVSGAQKPPAKPKEDENDANGDENEAGQPPKQPKRTRRKGKSKGNDPEEEEEPEEEKQAEEEENEGEVAEEDKEEEENEVEDGKKKAANVVVDEVSGRGFMLHWGCFIVQVGTYLLSKWRLLFSSCG